MVEIRALVRIPLVEKRARLVADQLAAIEERDEVGVLDVVGEIVSDSGRAVGQSVIGTIEAEAA